MKLANAGRSWRPGTCDAGCGAGTHTTGDGLSAVHALCCSPHSALVPRSRPLPLFESARLLRQLPARAGRDPSGPPTPTPTAEVPVPGPGPPPLAVCSGCDRA
eukprot:scaffold15662_cov109-Isochrysis_galbana.AAC.13